MPEDFYRQLGISVSTITFAAALLVFILAAATGVPNTISSWLLFAASFLLMMRFWFRYNELFVRYLPSRTYWQFLLDFLVSFFGILAVLVVGSVQIWALFGALAMLASALRCLTSRKDGDKAARNELRKTFTGAVAMAVLMGAIYLLAPTLDSVALSAAAFALILVFVIYSTRK